MADLFWRSQAQSAVIEPFMLKNRPGPKRKDDRQIISGIPHVRTPGAVAGAIAQLLTAAYHGLQPLQPLVAARLLESHARLSGQGWTDRRCSRPP